MALVTTRGRSEMGAVAIDVSQATFSSDCVITSYEIEVVDAGNLYFSASLMCCSCGGGDLPNQETCVDKNMYGGTTDK